MFSPDIEQLAQLMGQDPSLKKALSAASSNFIGINLERPAKLMMPFVAPLRAKLPTDTPQQGGAFAWYKTQLGFGTYDFGANMGSAEAAIGTGVDGSAIDIQSAYKTQAVSGEVLFEAIPMGKGFDDANAIEVSRSLATFMRQEEYNLLGGNAAALAAPTNLVGAAVGTASLTVPAYFTVTALTLQGVLADAYNTAGPHHLGESVKATEAAITGSGASKEYFTLSWDPVPGAVAYVIYAGATGAETWVDPQYCYYLTSDRTAGDKITLDHATQRYVTVTALAVKHAASSGAMPTVDGTANALMYEGLYAWCQKNTIYGQALGSTGHKLINMAGQSLTQAGSGIAEFDEVLGWLWSKWNIGPQLIITSPNGAAAVSDALIQANNVPLYRIDISPERGGFTGGTFVSGYVNKFAASVLGNQQATIEVWAHPYAVDGTYQFITTSIPYGYSREARGYALDILQPYTYFPLAQTQRSYPFSLFNIQTLKGYHPLASAAIVGARVEA